MWNGREDAEARCAEIERKYTPTTSDDDLGFVDLVVKLYAGSQLERFPVRVRVRVRVRSGLGLGLALQTLILTLTGKRSSCDPA